MKTVLQSGLIGETNIRAASGDIPAATELTLPSLFLMVNSLETGGSERQFVALTQNIDRNSFSVELGCIQPKGPFLKDLPPISAFSLGGSLYSLKSIRSRVQLAHLLRTRRIKIAHSFDFYTNLVLIPVARLLRIPVVIGSHRQIGDLLTPNQFRMQLMTFHICDAVICNSHAAAGILQERGIPKEKLAVIWNGVPDSAFAQAPPLLPRVPGVVRIGMIARMNHRLKNHSGFLRAAAHVAARCNSAEFVLVGDGPFREDLESEAQSLGLGKRVRFLGDCRDIPAALASMDLTVLPSYSESLSNSIIESMAAGIPVIAYRVGGNVELIDDNRGTLVTAGNDMELAMAIYSLLCDEKLRKQLGENARNYARSQFTIDEMRRRHEELYTNLLRKKGLRLGPASHK